MANESATTPPRRLQTFFLWFGLFLAAFFALLPYLSDSTGTRIAATLGQLFFTTYIAYVITKDVSEGAAREALESQRKTAREELRDLAEASGRRVFLLSAHMQELAEEALEAGVEDGHSKVRFESMAAELARLASHAELSFRDLQQMAKLDVSIPALKDEARTKVVEMTRREMVNCPRCNKENDIFFGTAPGATRHHTCSNAHCRAILVLHRLPDESIKVGMDRVRSIDCPNPECSNDIKIKIIGSEYGVVVRNCYDCFARIRFDIDSDKVAGWELEAPLSLAVSQIVDNRGPCPYCNWSVQFKQTRNKAGLWVQFCPHCTKLIRVQEHNDA